MADPITPGAQNSTDAPGQDKQQDTPPQAQDKQQDTPPQPAGEDKVRSLLDDEPGEGEGGEKKQDAAPEEYKDFAFPEGMVVDPAFMTQAKSIFKDANLSQDNAQKLVDLVIERDKQVEKAQLDLAKKWAEDFMSKPTAKEDLAYAAKARSFVTPGLREMLKDPRIGNNPEILATLAKVGRAISEDRFEDQGGDRKGGDKSMAEAIFGDMPGLPKN